MCVCTCVCVCVHMCVCMYVLHLHKSPMIVTASTSATTAADHAQVSPRASIFRRDQGGLSSLDDMKRLMRYNGYPSDTLSDGHPYASVCARGDLAPHGVTPGAVPKGCYDTKVTSYKLAMVMESEVVGGPTTSGGALPPFEWDKRWKNFEHRGMPDRCAHMATSPSVFRNQTLNPKPTPIQWSSMPPLPPTTITRALLKITAASCAFCAQV